MWEAPGGNRRGTEDRAGACTAANGGRRRQAAAVDAASAPMAGARGSALGNVPGENGNGRGRRPDCGTPVSLPSLVRNGVVVSGGQAAGDGEGCAEVRPKCRRERRGDADPDGRNRVAGCRAGDRKQRPKAPEPWASPRLLRAGARELQRYRFGHSSAPASSLALPLRVARVRETAEARRRPSRGLGFGSRRRVNVRRPPGWPYGRGADGSPVGGRGRRDGPGPDGPMVRCSWREMHENEAAAFPRARVREERGRLWPMSPRVGPCNAAVAKKP